MKRKPVIGVDFDDTLVNTTAALAAFHNAKYSTNYRFEDVTSWHLPNLWGCSSDELTRRILEFYGTQYHADIQPIAGAADALTLIKEHARVSVVTARHPDTRWVTEDIAYKFFDGLLSGGIHYIGDVPSATHIVSKADTCAGIGFSAFVEDNLTQATLIAGRGIPVCLMDKP